MKPISHIKKHWFVMLCHNPGELGFPNLTFLGGWQLESHNLCSKKQMAAFHL
jgi:hypothetical protein